MLYKKNFFNNFNFNLTTFNKNLKKTKTVFEEIKSDLKNFEIPLFLSYDKSYTLNF